MLHPIKDALRDIGDAVRRRRVWMALASEDIGDAHRRTLLGPLWLLLNYLAFVGVIVLIIRSGLQVRHVKRPTAFWAPKNNPKGKISHVWPKISPKDTPVKLLAALDELG